MKRNLMIFLMFGILTFPAYKALRHPGMISGHDTESAVFKTEEFFNALKDGNFPPRWAKRLDYGLGQPTFIFTYTMPYYLTALPMLVNSGPVWAFKIIMALSFPAGAFFMYLWLKPHFKTLPAICGGLLYTYVPYHFANVYVRGAIGETTASVFLPLAFWGIDRVIEKPNWHKSGITALLIMFVILSHSFYGLVFSIIWAGYALVQAKGNKQILKFTLIAITWGYICSAFYIIPAFVYKNSTYLDNIEQYLLDKKPFISFDRLIYSTWGFDGAHEIDKDPMSVQIGIVSLVLFLAWIAKIKKVDKITIFFGTVVAGAIAMMLPISLPVWELIKPLRALQFPWRLLFVVNLGTTFCAAWVVNKVAGVKQWLIIPVIMVVVIVSSKSFWSVGSYFPYEDKTVNAIGYPGTLTLLLEETPKWHNRNEEANPYNFIQNAGGNATSLTSLVWRTNYHKFEAVTEKEIYISDKTHYWPGWKVWVDGNEEKTLDPYDPIAHGLITFKIGPGKHSIVSKLVNTPVEKFANTLSLCAILTIGLLSVLNFRKHEVV